MLLMAIIELLQQQVLEKKDVKQINTTQATKLIIFF
jgi:hypothetical protein